MAFMAKDGPVFKPDGYALGWLKLALSDEAGVGVVSIEVRLQVVGDIKVRGESRSRRINHCFILLLGFLFFHEGLLLLLRESGLLGMSGQCKSGHRCRSMQTCALVLYLMLTCDL